MPTTNVTNHPVKSPDSDYSSSSSSSDKVSISSTDSSDDSSETSIDTYVEASQDERYVAAATANLPPSPAAALVCSLVMGVSCTVTGVALAIVHGTRLTDPANPMATSDAAFATAGSVLGLSGLGIAVAGIVNHFIRSEAPACALANPA